MPKKGKEPPFLESGELIAPTDSADAKRIYCWTGIVFAVRSTELSLLR